MSFLSRTSTATLRTLRFAPTARFSTVVPLRNSAVNSVKDAAKKIDRTVSDAAVSGIEAGERVAGKVKESAGMSSDDASAKASQLTNEASGKASELTGQAKGKAHEMAGKAQGKAEEIKGKL